MDLATAFTSCMDFLHGLYDISDYMVLDFLSASLSVGPYHPG